ncbi:MAG: leucine-rich repeat domain-containing protein [Bacteroidaceae bacterium]|nr:leucine-rich repeat domain-containing protein [Bacteroidaceae bacterium]
MTRLSFLLMALFTTVLISPSTAQDYIIEGGKTGSDLVFDGNSVVSNGGQQDTPGSNKYYGDIFIPEKNGNTTITTLEKRSSWTQAGAGTFQYSYITTATLPKTITDIQTAAFADCIYLQNINVSDENETYFDNDGVVYKWLVKDPDDPFNPEKNQFELVACPGAKTNVTILDGTTIIGDCAFDGCSNIKGIIIPATVTEIHQYAFTGTNLTSLTCLAATPPEVMGQRWNANNTHGFYGMETAIIKVPYGTGNTYEAASRWGNFEIVELAAIAPEEEDTPEIEYIQHVEKIILSDSEDYTREERHTIGDEMGRTSTTTGNITTINVYYSSSATYERTFKNSDWQALYTPFEFQKFDYREDMMEVAVIEGVTDYIDSNNNVTYFYLTARTLDNDTEVITAHTPCLIRSKSASAEGVERDIDLQKGVDNNNQTIARHLEPASEKRNATFTSNNGNTYTLVGQYEKRTAGEIASEDGATGIYALSGGKLRQAGNNNVTLGAYRWYLTITPGAKSANTTFKFGQFQQWGTTDITTITEKTGNEKEQTLYDLHGRPVNSPTKGIYIKNGKKIYIK